MAPAVIDCCRAPLSDTVDGGGYRYYITKCAPSQALLSATVTFSRGFGDLYVVVVFC
jgi:hypothetical protein